MNGEGGHHDRLREVAAAKPQLATDGSATTGGRYASAVVDLRLHVVGPDESAVLGLVQETLELVRARAPEGVDARWTALRPARRSRSFVPTMTPTHRRRAA